MTDISPNQDLIDIRDVIERYEELEQTKQDSQGEEGGASQWLEEEETELKLLESLLEALKGRGGDEQWKGDWYPITLIREDYFEDYAKSLAEDIGAIDANAAWPNNCIDWEQAAYELEQDYTTVEYDGVTFYYR